MVQKDLKGNLDYVKKNIEPLLKQHKNKYILVFDKKLVDSYDTYERAAGEGVRLYGPEANFLVYHLVEKEPLNFIMEATL